MKNKVYQYVIVHCPKKDDKTETFVCPETIGFPMGMCIAKNEDHARVIASKAIPAACDHYLDEIEIIIRPF